jgi:thioredoxin 1
MATTKPGFLARMLGAGKIDARATGDVDDHAHGAHTDEDSPATDQVHLLEITDATFMAETATGHTMVDFWAPWCGPCTSFHPLYQQLATDHADDPVRFARLNVDEAPRSAQLVGIQSIPTVVLFDPTGNEVERIVGVPRKHDVQRLVKSAAHG